MATVQTPEMIKNYLKRLKVIYKLYQSQYLQTNDDKILNVLSSLDLDISTIERYLGGY
jgi:hypothetical protein